MKETNQGTLTLKKLTAMSLTELSTLTQTTQILDMEWKTKNERLELVLKLQALMKLLGIEERRYLH